MEEAVSFAMQYAELVYATRIAFLTERDPEKWKAQIAAIQAVTAHGCKIEGTQRHPEPKDEWFDEVAHAVEKIHLRKIFQIKAYEGKERTIYQAYMSKDSGRFWDKLYDISWFFTLVDGAFQVVGHALACWECMCLGCIDEKQCSECKGFGWLWYHRSSVKFSKPATAVRKFQAPFLDEHLQEYESD